MYTHDTKAVLRTHKQRKAARKNWDTVFDEIAYYVLPSQSGFITEFVPGERTRWSLRFDSTAGYANKKLANHLHMSLVSPSTPWFDAILDDEELNRMDVVKEWLQDCTRRMRYEIGKSNFNAQINTFLQIFCALGTSEFDVNFESRPDNPFVLLFKTGDLGLCTFDYNASYRIDTKVEEYKFTERQAQERFPDAELTAEHGIDGERTVKVLRIVRPNPDYVPESLNPKERAYLIEWCHKEEVFHTETAYEQPFMVARVSEIKQDGIYGEGFGLNCLSDVRSINVLKRLELRSAEKAVDPPLIASANAIMSDLHIEAGGVTIVRNPRDIGELPGQMKAEIVMYKSEDLRQAILAAYSINDIMVPERKGQNPITATEVQVRQEQAQKMLGAAVGRLKDELLTPMLNRVFGLMLRNGRFTEMPEELSGADIDLTFIGPLAKAQNIDEAYAVERALQTSMGISQLTQSVSKVIDFDKAERLLYDRYGVPAEVTRSEEEVEQMKRQEQQAQQQQAEQEQAMQQAQVQEQQANADGADVELLQNVRGLG